MGSILGSAKAGADLDYHMICVEDGIIDDEPEVHEFLMKQVLSKFIDVVHTQDVVALGNRKQEE